MSLHLRNTLDFDLETKNIMESNLNRLLYTVVILLAIPACFALSSVFLQKSDASRVITHRVRRANSFLEELKLGDLERECLEEICSYEEAREIFSVPEQLEDFWRRYTEPDPCQSNPCQNGATCVHQVNTYICICTVNYEGRNCNKEIFPHSSYRCLYKNGGCDHFCTEISESTRECECAPGYRLQADNTSCVPEDMFPCGRLKDVTVGPRIIKGDVCPKGQCPWQALLEYKGEYKCGGVIVDSQWIATAAHCVWGKETSHLQVTVGEHIRLKEEGTEQIRKVSKVLIHPFYNHSITDSDIALLHLFSPVTFGPYALPICLPPANGTFARTLGAIRMAMVSGWGRLAQSGPSSMVLQRLEVPKVSSDECRTESGLKITRNMLCAGFTEGGRDSCQGDSGGPLVTRYKNTWFLTGIVSWGKGCAHSGVYGIYTRVSVFVNWITKTVKTA
ncbi:coagulation factor VII [Triplophysa dalaica]|uniref:coagulation factor VII n=1 Tax=Triplophysa dalaica TaxID=1582913 RepID=UPI0024DF31B9|nr:coagulation factor VII [Triplophysa dalaica]